SIAYNPLAFDPAQLVARIAADRPDYLWDVSYIDDGVAIWREVVDSGLKLKAAVGTSSAFCMPAFGQRLGQQAVGVFAADKPDAAYDAGQNRRAAAVVGQWQAQVQMKVVYPAAFATAQPVITP